MKPRDLQAQARAHRHQQSDTRGPEEHDRRNGTDRQHVYETDGAYVKTGNYGNYGMHGSGLRFFVSFLDTNP